MKIIFGMYLDGAQWSHEGASVGEIQTGPAGLLGLLETRLGLKGPTTHPAQRINEYMRRLELCDRPDAWFHRSFSADAWSTAKQMLAWRDELVEVGWDGMAPQASSSQRLRALADVEAAKEVSLSYGREDRLQEVLRALRHGDNCDIVAIRTLEPPDLLPPVWKRVFSLLKAGGAAIEHGGEERVPADERGNLFEVKRAFTSENYEVKLSPGDESLIMLKANDEWEAAEHLAIWLAADKEANEHVTIICSGPSGVLDQAFARQGLPAIGSTLRTRWRSVLQVLPLVLANAWKPLDIRLLVELLALPRSPVPPFAAARLLKAIREEPGVGGRAWSKAIDDIASTGAKFSKKSGRGGEAQKDFASELDRMLAIDRFYPEPGIPEEDLRARCQWVIDRLAPRIETSPIYGEAISHARMMQKLSRGKGVISRVKIERMLDSVIAVGCPDPDIYREASPWSVVQHPQQITWTPGTVVWWGFNEEAQQARTYWSNSERTCLGTRGVELEPARVFRMREALSWRQSVFRARNSLLFIVPGRVNGQEVSRHPFWDDLSSAALKSGGLEERDIPLTRRCTELISDGEWRLAGRTMKVSEVEPHTLKKPPAVRRIAGHLVPPPARLSYTQMSTMISCPMRWVLQYHGKLHMPDALALSTGDQAIGSLTHHIVECLYAEPVRQWSADEARERAGELYDELVQSWASEFLLEGYELENSRYRATVVKAVWLLVKAINDGNLSVITAEYKVEKKFMSGGSAIPFTGSVDLLLRDEQGRFFVMDMKWSRGGSYYRKKVEDGAALQLAAYAWLLRDAHGKWPHAAYFLLARGELLSDSTLFGREAIRSKRSTSDVWNMGVLAWEERLREIKSGFLEASGVAEEEMESSAGLSRSKVEELREEERSGKNQLYLQPPCRFCEFDALCGLRGGAS